MTEEKYSFSKLENFHNCRRGYYYDYIEKDRGGDNIYSYMGSITHEITQAMIQKQISNDDAVKQFIEAIDDAEMLDLEWMSDKVRDKYVDCITHFLENYDPIDNPTMRIEDYVELDVNGVIMRGYIDIWYRKGDTIYIEDLKTSTKFSKKDLPKKSRQLLFYALALSEKYPDYNIVLQFNMLKYGLRKGKLVERINLDLFDEFTDGIVEVNYDEESINDVKEYITDTVNKIKAIKSNDIEYWYMDNNPEKDFFCRNLCSHRNKCLERLGK